MNPTKRILRELRDDSGIAMITVMGISVILFIMLTTMFVLTNYRTAQSTFNTSRTQAVQLADAGINYYLYRLSVDYQYANTSPAPAPTLTNSQGTWAASATYDSASRLIVIRSRGTTKDGLSRTVVAKCSPPPPPMYAVGSGGNIDVGGNTTINGPMRSNGYVHITTGGTAGIITGLAQSGTTPNGDFSPKVGGVPDPGRFKGGASYYPALSFDTFSSDVAAMKGIAGLLLPTSRSDGKTPTAMGYLITLSNNQVIVRRVTAVATTHNSAATVANLGSITSTVPPSVTSTYAIPANGVIFVDSDNVWVQGTYTARVTICASRANSSDTTYGNINVIDSVLCGDTSNPTVVCGLMAQNSVYLCDWYSRTFMDPTLTIQAALLAQYGGVNDSNMPSGLSNLGGTKYSSSPLTYWPYHDLALAGSVLGRTGIGFDGTYFVTRTYGFDQRLVTNPPPYWPRGDNQWVLVSSWAEN